MHRAAEELRFHLAGFVLGGPRADALADFFCGGGRSSASNATAGRRNATIFADDGILPICAEMPDIFSCGSVHDQHAAIAVTIGDIHQVRFRIDHHVGRPERLRRAVDSAIRIVAVGPFAPGVPICITNVPSDLNFRICESLPNFGAQGYWPWKLRACPLPAR